MKSKTHHTPSVLITLIGRTITEMANKMARRRQGDVTADKEILNLIFYADDHIKKLIYSFLYMLEHDGSLNAANIPALKQIEEMDDHIRRHSKEGISEEDYLRRLAAHLEALTEEKLNVIEKRMKHLELAEKYAKLADVHEKIANQE